LDYLLAEVEIRAAAAYTVECGKESQHEHSIFVIKPYKWEGMWVFDDPAAARPPTESGKMN